MQCPSCGALREIGVDQCPECEALASTPVPEEPGAHPTSSLHMDTAETVAAAEAATREPALETSRLIEFPGVSRNSVPQWRKQLSERVREIQEKRAREAALEAAEEKRRANDVAASSLPPLELLPQAEVVPLNPVVAAALRRIERAHQLAAESVDHSSGVYAVAAVAYATSEHQLGNETSQRSDVAAAVEDKDFPKLEDTVSEAEVQQPEKLHNLVVVPRVAKTENLETESKPRRMIADNDPALNYLDSVPTSVRVEVAGHRKAPALSRLLGATIDLMVVAFLCAPYLAVVELTNSNWQNWGVAATGAVVFAVVSFLYLTISTALTGRTLGTRLLSLRIVDARTGLIPTGSQSAGRALIYLATLLTLGLACLYELIDPDKRTPQDRLTRTIVIAV